MEKSNPIEELLSGLSAAGGFKNIVDLASSAMGQMQQPQPQETFQESEISYVVREHFALMNRIVDVLAAYAESIKIDRENERHAGAMKETDRETLIYLAKECLIPWILGNQGGQIHYGEPCRCPNSEMKEPEPQQEPEPQPEPEKTN
jgi:hypothetical protein